MTINPAPAGDPPNPNPAPAGDPPAPTAAELTIQLAETRRALKAANDESAQRRQRLKELEDAEEARKSASLSELEKANKARDDAAAAAETAKQAATTATARATERLQKAAVISAATRAGFADPEDAWVHVDRAKVTTEDDGDTWKGVAEAVAAVAKAKPYLVGEVRRANGTPRPGQKLPAPPNEKKPKPSVRL